MHLQIVVLIKLKSIGGMVGEKIGKGGILRTGVMNGPKENSLRNGLNMIEIGIWQRKATDVRVNLVDGEKKAVVGSRRN